MKIVCLGGGRGTSNLLSALKKYNPQITVVTSMADDGGSSGRLRKAYRIMPPGDIVSCISSLISDDKKELKELLTYRFGGTGNTDREIDGHKLGNLIMLAEILRTKNFYKAIEAVKKLANVKADIFPASEQRVSLTAITKDGRRIHSETTMDLAKYSQPYGFKNIYLTPKNPKINSKIIKNLMEADLIISGPGDLYTNQLPVLIVPLIKEAILASKAVKIFILNIANKPFETKGYTLLDFVNAIKEHLGSFPYNYIMANNNYSIPIPKKFRYGYVLIDKELDQKSQPFSVIRQDFVNPDFPIYHDPTKLASAIMKLYNANNRTIEQ
jgi:uncharacterized cofD-like protein